MSDDLPCSALDTHFARLMVQLHGRADADLELAARTVSARRGEGHICVALAEIGGAGLAKKLRATRVVGAPGEFKPLILDESGRLYLQRYWAYEAELAAAIRQRLVAADCNETLLQKELADLFPKSGTPDWQRVAAETAVRKKFCVITGGPGTGKTYTMARLLALLAGQFAARGKRPRLALAAPTGKAAARMQESLRASIDTMPNGDELRSLLPAEAGTIHRLLGTMPGSPYFRHDRDRPLPIDAVIIDEASMVDLALMAKLFAALPEAARVILIGDRDQLASVEAGNVLGDICGLAAGGRDAPIAAHIVELKTARRFRTDSGIQRLSSLVNEGDAEGALGFLRTADHPDIASQPTPAARALEAALRPPAITGFRPALEAPDAISALTRLEDFRIFCATRRGPHGVENLNALVERLLAAEGLIEPAATHYHGRPVLVRTNDYQLRIFNGDVGLILRDPEADGELRAFFRDGAGAVRRVLPARLPAHETSFAMTVHKSQGSEFERVLLILPDRETPLATRELLYTGLTRARREVEIWADDATLRMSIERRTVRTSGLRDALWNA